jgi:predicted nucleic acid-binding protein
LIVLDSSAVLALLLGKPAARGLHLRAARRGESLHAPYFVDVEVVDELRRLVRAGQLDTGDAGEALTDLIKLDLQRYPHDALLERAWELREHLSVSDGLYVALAEFLEAPLVTLDDRLAASTVHQARIDLLA